MTKKTVPSRTAVRLQAALGALAMDAKPNLAPCIAGITAKNFKAWKPTIAKRARVAFDEVGATGATPDDVILKVLDLVESQTAQADPMEEDEVGGGATDPNAGPPAAAAASGEEDDDDGKLGKLMEFLKSKGMGEDDMAAISSMMGDPQASMDEETDEEKAVREKKEAEEKAAKDAMCPPGGVAAKDKSAKDKAARDEPPRMPMVSKAAMDAALLETGRVAAQEALNIGREIAAKLTYVRPWVGELANDASITCAADVTRKALVSLGVSGAATMHADALDAVLANMPKPGAASRREATLATDSAPVQSVNERFAHLAHV